MTLEAGGCFKPMMTSFMNNPLKACHQIEWGDEYMHCIEAPTYSCAPEHTYIQDHIINNLHGWGTMAHIMEDRDGNKSLWNTYKEEEARCYILLSIILLYNIYFWVRAAAQAPRQIHCMYSPHIQNQKMAQIRKTPLPTLPLRTIIWIVLWNIYRDLTSFESCVQFSTNWSLPSADTMAKSELYLPHSRLWVTCLFRFGP